MAQAEKANRYRDALQTLQAILRDEQDWICILSTTAAVLHEALEAFHWTGFYRVAEPGMLVVGPYQGHQACLRIPFGQGVWGKAAQERQTYVVPDVHAFPGYIACSPTTQSEIVVPVLDSSGHVRAVLDIDSDWPAAFDQTDAHYLSRIAAFIGQKWSRSVRSY